MRNPFRDSRAWYAVSFTGGAWTMAVNGIGSAPWVLGLVEYAAGIFGYLLAEPSFSA